MSNIIVPKRGILMPTREGFKAGGFYIVDMIRPSWDNEVIWREEMFENLIVNEGLEELFTNGLTGSALYLGLTGTTPNVQAADTLASKSWTEFTGYDEVTRELWDFVQTVASATNAASRAEFTITSPAQTIGGVFAARSSTKAETASVLYSAAAFATGDRTGNQAGDIIRQTYIANATDDGI